MPAAASENTVVLAVYSARHYAEMAKNYLADQKIDAFVAADDVHVPMQMTEGARLLVLESHARAAREALEVADLLPEDIAADDDAEEEG